MIHISSPANLLMYRTLRSVLPFSNDHLKPKNVSVREKMIVRQEKMKYFYDRNAKYLSKIKTGDRIVFIHRPKWIPATVVQELILNRSFILKTPEGVQYERNRVHMKKLGEDFERQEPTGNSVIAQQPPTPLPIRRSARPVVLLSKFKDFVMNN